MNRLRRPELFHSNGKSDPEYPSSNTHSSNHNNKYLRRMRAVQFSWNLHQLRGLGPIGTCWPDPLPLMDVSREQRRRRRRRSRLDPITCRIWRQFLDGLCQAESPFLLFMIHFLLRFRHGSRRPDDQWVMLIGLVGLYFRNTFSLLSFAFTFNTKGLLYISLTFLYAYNTYWLSKEWLKRMQ